MLVELARLDPGLDVDWVVGLVSPLPLVSMSFHDLGWAEVPGRHFVLRGMSSIPGISSVRCTGLGRQRELMRFVAEHPEASSPTP